MARTDFHLYFPDETAARAAGRHVSVPEDSWRIRRGAEDPSWLLTLAVEIDDVALDQWEEDLESLARRFGGEYDGFERDVGRR